MKHKLLIVDDDKSILLSLKDDLKNDDYEIITAQSGEEALLKLNNTSVSIIISDVLMPGMNGVEFLEKSIPLNPDAIRIVLSGNSELELIKESINKGHIWHYIPKPWHKLKLKVTIKNAIEIFEAKENEKKLINDLKIKTELLQSLNEHLEEIVSQRTWKIHKRSELLSMLLEGCDIEELLFKTCRIISELIKGRPVYLKSNYLNKIISTDETNNIPQDLLTIIQKCEKQKTNYVSPNGIGLVLCNMDTYLGTLLYYGEMDHDEEIEEVEDFVYVITFALSQKKVLESTPDILKNIDLLIEDL